MKIDASIINLLFHIFGARNYKYLIFASPIAISRLR